jgi:hypothetical protein
MHFKVFENEIADLYVIYRLFCLWWAIFDITLEFILSFVYIKHCTLLKITEFIFLMTVSVAQLSTKIF